LFTKAQSTSSERQDEIMHSTNCTFTFSCISVDFILIVALIHFQTNLNKSEGSIKDEAVE